MARTPTPLGSSQRSRAAGGSDGGVKISASRAGEVPPPDGPDQVVTRAELAAWLGLSTRSVGDHAAQGRLVKRGQGYALRASVRAFVAYQREAQRGQEVQEARGRLEGAKARLAEIKLAQIEGNLVDAAEVEQTWSSMILRCRNRILAVPARLGHRLGHLGTMEIRIIDHELREALTELADDTQREGT